MVFNKDKKYIDLQSRIKNNYKKFSESQKLLAEYLLKNSEKVAFFTAANLGKIIGVSESTVVRFANILEYELFSFREIKSQSSGHTSYVSRGAHDDTVMGLAMSVKYIKLLQDFVDYIGVA